MKLNRKWILVIALLLSVAVATAGTLAYLTDRDSEANVFTIGNVEIDLTEDFEEGAELIPGVEIEKKPVITNTGKNDAYVWMTWSIPAALDNPVQGTEQGSNENVIHWNPLGATTEGYVNDTRVEKAIADGHLPEGLTAAKINSENMTWNVFNSLGEGKNMYQEEIDGVLYNTYVLLYNKALEPGETTLPSVYKVFLDEHVDIDPYGNMNRVENGNVKKLDWNITDDGNPKIYVSAYAIQTDGLKDMNGDEVVDVKDAYALYNQQWGENGKEIDDRNDGIDSELPVFIPETAWADNADTSWYTDGATEYTISTAEQLAGLAVKVNQDKVTFRGKTVKLGADIDLADHLWEPIGQTGATEFKGVFDGNNKVISNMYIDSSDETGAHYSSGLFGWVENHGEGITIKNVVVDRAYVTGHHNVAVIAGYIYGYIDNCTVTNSTVICTHANDDACGDKAGIIAGYAGDGAFTNNTAKDCTVTASRDAGQLFGCVIATEMKNHVGNSAENVTVEAEADSECPKHNTNIKNEIFGRY